MRARAINIIVGLLALYFACVIFVNGKVGADFFDETVTSRWVIHGYGAWVIEFDYIMLGVYLLRFGLRPSARDSRQQLGLYGIMLLLLGVGVALFTGGFR